MIPDRLTADLSESYKVSIRLTPDGLSFCGHIPSQKDSSFTESYPFDPALSAVQSLKNIFFNHPFFSYVYQSIQVICVSETFTLSPEHVFSEPDKEQLFFFCHLPNPSLKVISQPLEALGAFMLFGIDKEVYAFLIRSLSSPVFVHSLSPVLLSWQKKSQLLFHKQMYVIIHEDRIEVMCLQQGELLFANVFKSESVNDMIYYIMYICKQTGFDQLDDALKLSGNKAKCQEAMSVIANYIKQAAYIQTDMMECEL